MHCTKILEKLGFDLDMGSIQNKSMYMLSYNKIIEIHEIVLKGNVQKTIVERMSVVIRIVDCSHIELMNEKWSFCRKLFGIEKMMYNDLLRKNKITMKGNSFNARIT
jgi:hypothetical protein